MAALLQGGCIGELRQQFRATSADSDMPMTRVLCEFDHPAINVKTSEIGLSILAMRDINATLRSRRYRLGDEGVFRSVLSWCDVR